MKRPRPLAVPLLAVVLAAAAGCSSAATAPQSAATSTPAAPAASNTLISQSHGESGLIIYGNTPSSVFQPLLTAFTKAYPWIRPQYSQLSDNQVFTKYESEHAQGATSADLLISSSIPQFLQAEQNGQLANITPAGLADFPAYMNQGHGVYVFSPDPVTVAWNAKMLRAAQVPTTYAQLASEVKAGPGTFPLTSYSPANPLGYAAVYGLVHILGASTVYADLDTLGTHTKTYDEGLDGLQYMAQGGASVGYLASGLAQAVIPQYKGLLGYGFMADATPLVPRLVAQSAGASNPASAQLFLDFAYSQAGQQMMCAAGMEAAINNFHPQTGCTADLADLSKKVPVSAQYLVPVSEDVVNQQQTITANWNKALGH